MVPLLKAKKDFDTMIENAYVRLKLINDKIGEVEMQEMNKIVIFLLLKYRLLILWNSRISI